MCVDLEYSVGDILPNWGLFFLITQILNVKEQAWFVHNLGIVWL